MLLETNNFKVLFSTSQIKDRVQELGMEISKKFSLEENLTAICVLQGSFMFYSDLIRNIDRDLQCDFISTSTYIDRTNPQCYLTLDLTSPIKDRHILLIKDIVATGLSLEYLTKLINIRKPKSLTTVTLLLRSTALQTKSHIDYVGFETKEQCILGYGLEHQGYFRNLPYIAQVQQNLN